MKKLAFLVVTLLTISQITNAQSNIRFGVKAGLNYANFTNTKVQTDAITNYHAGILVEISLFDNLAIQPELLYSTVGASYDSAITEFKNELGYISIPVVAKFNLSESLFLEAGPQGSFLLSKKDEVFDDYNKVDFSVNAGVGINLTKNLFASARYNVGVTEIARDADAKNSVFQLSVGLLF
ncbi:porin family protein [uncultured Flavobacterium sp.]|uniref:porin family protein n=1 Tax=uncultured Flavobacterium sp. TaxID=165435 RepID=UPI0030EB29AF|tara:strand:+ start:1801 stop:2343 length:543 start_codon:yes stop_codon:yes gene_type:complete